MWPLAGRGAAEMQLCQEAEGGGVGFVHSGILIPRLS